MTSKEPADSSALVVPDSVEHAAVAEQKERADSKTDTIIDAELPPTTVEAAANMINMTDMDDVSLEEGQYCNSCSTLLLQEYDG
jgi:hypothetical protein